MFWALAPDSGFNPHPGVKEGAGWSETVLGHLHIREVLVGDGKRWQSSCAAHVLARTLLSTQALVCAPSLASPTGRGAAWVKEMVFGFPGGGQTRISGSLVLHMVYSLKRSKHVYFWQKTAQIPVAVCQQSSLTSPFTEATPKLQHHSLSLLGKQSFSYWTSFPY